MDSKVLKQEIHPNVRKFNRLTAGLRACLKRIPKPEKQPYRVKKETSD